MMTAKAFKWSKGKQIAVFAAAVTLLSLALIAILLAYAHAQMLADSEWELTIRQLRSQRYMWLEDGCPQPPQAANYMIMMPPVTNYSLPAMLMVSNRTYHGLFATRSRFMTNTLVITTTGDILVLEDSGHVRWLEKASAW